MAKHDLPVGIGLIASGTVIACWMCATLERDRLSIALAVPAPIIGAGIGLLKPDT